MTYLEIFIFGIKHIAENHNAEYSVSDLHTEGQVCILDTKVPTIADVQFLCEDVGISMKCIEVSEFGIDIEIPYYWYKVISKQKYVGGNFWLRGELPHL